MRDILGVEPTPYQCHILDALLQDHRVAVKSPHGGGKTATAAWIILWAVAMFEDVKVPTTASNWRQLTKYLWPEIHKWARKARWDKLGLTIRYGRELFEQSLKLAAGREAFALASNDPAAIEGAHAKTIVYVLDEAKAIATPIWDAIEGAFSTAGKDTNSNAYALAISTPGDTVGRFYDIHRHKPGYEDWTTIHITLEECIAAGQISQEWADRRKLQWGENSAVYQNRVLGEFATAGEQTVIPLAWVEAAMDRWQNCNGSGLQNEINRLGETYNPDKPPILPLAYGVDVARSGADKTAVAKLRGRVIERIDYYSQQDTMQTVGALVVELGNDVITPIAVDVIGIGAGVFDRLKELGYNAIPVNVSSAADRLDSSGAMGFINLRAALWWCFGRELLLPDNPDPIALPPDDLLTGDLTAPTYTLTSNGRYKVGSKDEIREQLGRSTDSADAVLMALYANWEKVHRPKFQMEWI